MPTLRELRVAKRRSAVSRTIACGSAGGGGTACRWARLRRTGAEASSAGARSRAAVTFRMLHQTVTEEFAARRPWLLCVIRDDGVVRDAGDRWGRCDHAE